MVTARIPLRVHVEWRSLVSIGCLLALLGGAAPVRAAGDDEARALLEKAKSAYALSHYAQAADYFEKAFELKADPALLYNAAQSHRLAGNKERALALFQNYLRVFDRDARYAQIVARIDELKRAIESDRKTSPPAPVVASGDTLSPKRPATVAPAPAASVAPAVAPPTAAASSPAPLPTLAPGSASSQPTGGALLISAPPAEETPLTHKPWFWGVVGGTVAVAVAVVLVVALSKTSDPSASLGSANGN